MSDRPSEVTELHTRLLRVTLEIEPSAAYWSHADPKRSHAEQAKLALEQQWFGERSSARVRKLVDELSSRFDPFPEALEVLHGWSDISENTRRLVCHWHVQLTDAIYRKFTGELLPELRGPEGAIITRELVADWIEQAAPGRWADSTKLKYAGNLLTTAAEAGLVSQPSRERTLLVPVVPDDGLAYLLHLIREVEFAGTLADNPYLRSVGMQNDVLEEAIARLAGRAEDGGFDLEWMSKSLKDWAAQRKA
jgi:BrxA